MSLPRLTLYGREYCSLCQDMLAQLRSLTDSLQFELNWVDIDDEDALEDKYGQLVPALVGEREEIICFYHLNRRQLDAYLGKIR
ncbi:glutaredoxin family protein [Parachitinimonas caeni]|uniref:Glutaredoxin family protein n=1 Tax=Parachitinimonas caeni TaxID=3031301 RepID=A0ABT7DVZ3_9NEIS|nr:glutaredoxin family protein [Parachitinimonas caeni]MDK2124232.1 glutaredoxin family protein [Parachitinimonas caeni]